jgi:hypothetical protein
MSDVQLVLDHLERPLPELPKEEWQRLWRRADDGRRDFWGKPRYDPEEGFMILLQWSKASLKYEFDLYGQRRTEPFPFIGDGKVSIEQWFESHPHDKSVAATWLIRLDQLRDLAS